ncbi:dihydroorotase [Oribacterium sp. WCC10]|uniref:dihydroorotase n=1 Tax=Oribacterium sp. WCC10 TaxID=1855343 RepID=UPI0008F26768|nr:dihydroorotase [Oribacterium sp. WCC10]SFG48890.1 dihydroorotase [Oribacterium sp. WCC10]
MKLIKHGRVIDPANNIDEIADIVIDDNGYIKEIGNIAESSTETEYDYIYDATGKVVAPGFVDVHVHFRDPGLTYKEDITTGASAAAAGGYTTVICMANTKPPVDSAETLKELVSREKQLPVHVLQTANVTMGMQGKELTDMKSLLTAGAVGFTDDGVPISDERLMVNALKTCKKLDVPISLHEEDPALMQSAGVNKGAVSEALNLGGAPDEAEYVLAARDIMLNRKIGAKLDIQHISSGVTVDVLRAAKKMGIRVYGEVTPQHLASTEDLVLSKGSLARVNPPLRTEEDRKALIRGLADGTIDMIATDHAPHSAEEKAKPISEAPSGMIGLETALGLIITHTVRTGDLTLSQIIKALTVNPAQLYKLNAGTLSIGAPADIVIFDAEEQWTVPDHFHSKATNSPFIGMSLYGKVKTTICSGRTVYQDEG